MELRHLRYFIAVAEQLHFGQAAEMLGIAAPTLTVQIQQIERTLDAQLFTRTKRSVALTQAGEAFLVEARAALEQFERAVNIGRRAGRGELGRVNLGFVGSAAFSGVLQQQVRAFREARPHVLIDTHEFPMDELPALLEDGRVDCGCLIFLGGRYRPMLMQRSADSVGLLRQIRLLQHLGVDSCDLSSYRRTQQSQLAFVLLLFWRPLSRVGGRRAVLFRRQLLSRVGGQRAVLFRIQVQVAFVAWGIEWQVLDANLKHRQE